MHVVQSWLAKELAEAILDASERAEYETVAVGVILVGGYCVATPSFDPEEACVVVVLPTDWHEDGNAEIGYSLAA